MPPRTKMLRDGPIGGKEPLGLTRRLKALHAPLALTGRLMRVLCTVIEVAMLTMFHPWQEFALSRSVALQFVSDDNARHDVERYVEEYMAAAGIGHKANETLLPHV